jgi:hypothetical protein
MVMDFTQSDKNTHKDDSRNVNKHAKDQYKSDIF